MKVIDFLFPCVCPVCREPVKGGRFAVHENCRRARIYVPEPFCMKCGRPMKDEKEYCEQCEGKEFPFDAGRCVFLYHSAIGSSIAAFKNKGFAEIPEFFAENAMRYHGAFIRATQATMIIPVPISKRKMRIRGFNQSARLAEALARKSGIQACDAVIKIKNTREQKSLSRQGRQKNLLGTFKVKEGVEPGKSVIVVDDIFTTGSTVSAVALALKKAGAENVYFICAASAHT